jgi:hypothetical protein
LNSNNENTSQHPSSSSSHSATTTITSMDPEEIELIKKLNKMIGQDAKQVETFKTISSSYYNNLLPAEKFLEAFILLVNKNDIKGKGKKKNMIDKIGGVWNQMAKNLLKKKDSSEGENIDFEKKCNDMLRAWNDYKIKQNDEEDYTSLLVEKKKNLTKSYASHATMPDTLTNLGINKPKSPAKVLVIKPAKNNSSSSLNSNRTHSPDSSFYERIAEKALQRDKKRQEREKANFILDTESSTSEEDSESEEVEENSSEEVNVKTTTSDRSTSGSPFHENNNTPTSKTVVENAVKYMSSNKHKINKYNSDFPSLSGSSTSAAAILAASSSSSSNNPYDRTKQQKNKFKPMSQKLRSQDEFPSLQSTRIKKQNNQIKQPRGKSSVLRIV